MKKIGFLFYTEFCSVIMFMLLISAEVQTMKVLCLVIAGLLVGMSMATKFELIANIYSKYNKQ